MEVTRILSLRQFDGVKCRFSNVVFKHSSGVAADTPDGKLGISVFRNDCACTTVTADCLCAHISQFYSQVFQQPCAYWSFDTELLQPPNPNPEGIPVPVLVKAPSDSGDECHHTIHHISDGRAKRLFLTGGHLGLCVEGRGVPFDCELAAHLKQQYYPDPA
jgi:hypothetical protein